MVVDMSILKDYIISYSTLTKSTKIPKSTSLKMVGFHFDHIYIIITKISIIYVTKEIDKLLFFVKSSLCRNSFNQNPKSIER